MFGFKVQGLGSRDIFRWVATVIGASYRRSIYLIDRSLVEALSALNSPPVVSFNQGLGSEFFVFWWEGLEFKGLRVMRGGAEILPLRCSPS